jgi:hypothetical protein
MQPTQISGIVQSISKRYIEIETEFGNTIKVARYMGSMPSINQAVIIDYTGSVVQIYPAPVISDLTALKRYLNFYAIEGESDAPATEIQEGDTGGVDRPDKAGQTSPFYFADMQLGGNAVSAGNGNVAFAGPTAAGIATSCESKMIVRDNGTAEIVTPHLMALYGRTIVVSDFNAGIHIEIDITSERSSGGAEHIQAIKTKVIEAMQGTSDSDKGPMTYELAFEDAIGEDGDPFVEMFGLHLGELLLTFKWERLLFRGNEQAFHEIFNSLGHFDSAYVYCGDCYGRDVVSSMELFLLPGNGDFDRAKVNVPACETANSDVLQINGFFNGEPYTIYAMNMVLRNGEMIEYTENKRSYSISHGIMAKKSWVSAEQSGLYAENFHANIDTIAFPDLNISPSAPGFCGGSVGIPSITWGGDMSLSVLGDFTVSASGSATMYGGTQAVLGGGTKGIRVDNNGSSAITL